MLKKVIFFTTCSFCIYFVYKYVELIDENKRLAEISNIIKKIDK